VNSQRPSACRRYCSIRGSSWATRRYSTRDSMPR